MLAGAAELVQNVVAVGVDEIIYLVKNQDEVNLAASNRSENSVHDSAYGEASLGDSLFVVKGKNISNFSQCSVLSTCYSCVEITRQYLFGSIFSLEPVNNQSSNCSLSGPSFTVEKKV